MMQVPVIALVVENIAKTLSVVIASPEPTDRSPAAPSNVLPLRSVNMATTPGTRGSPPVTFFKISS